MSAALAVGIGLTLTVLIAAAVGLLIYFVKPAGRGFGTFASTTGSTADVVDEVEDAVEDAVEDVVEDVRSTAFPCPPGATPMTVDGVHMCTVKRMIATSMPGTVMLTTERSSLSDAVAKCAETAGCTGLVQFAFSAVTTTTAAVDDTGTTFDHTFNYTSGDSPYFGVTGVPIPSTSTATIEHRAFV